MLQNVLYEFQDLLLRDNEKTNSDDVNRLCISNYRTLRYGHAIMQT